MIFRIEESNGHSIAVAEPGSAIIWDMPSALDVLAEVSYNQETDRLVLHRSNLSEGFFDLSTRLAGDVLQKFVNYQIKVAIVGDFSGNVSQSLRAFISESNRGSHVCFLPDEESALLRLSRP